MKKQSGKKLVEILAVELKEWPLVDGDYPKYIVQEGDGELFSTVKRKPRFGGDTAWYRADDDDSKCGYWNAHAELAADYATAIVTRKMWEAERAKLEGEKVMRDCVEKCEPDGKQKANAQGWIRHRGRKCPVARDEYISARLRSGEKFHGPAYGATWIHEGKPYDIMAYRIHQAEQSAEPVEVKSAEPEMPAAKYFDGPLQWRDRITEIDRGVEALEKERAILIQKLADEGFKLI